MDYFGFFTGLGLLILLSSISYAIVRVVRSKAK